jgi:hypothetical protein
METCSSFSPCCLIPAARTRSRLVGVAGHAGLRPGCETLPNSCQTHAPTGGSSKHVETHGSRSQMLAKEKDRLDMAALVNLRQLGANRLKSGC